MAHHQLEETAAAMVAPGKGILAADESVGTMSKRLEKAGIPASANTRRVYRAMILSTPGLAEFISGVILSDETFRQEDENGRALPAVAADAGIMPGIKVDTGAKPHASSEGETVTEGLDGLRDRIVEYVRMGARFAKWRAVIRVTERLPSDHCLAANAHALARYAALCQEAGVVPIVEPEVLMHWDHNIDRCAQVTERTLRRVFDELARHQVAPESIILKPNMVVPGKDARQVAPHKVAETTLRCLRRCVPAAVPGIAFLSGGQLPEEATVHLNALNLLGAQPWQLTFSFGRALLDPALTEWKGEESNVVAAQQALAHRVECNSAARDGR
jgi:fructose-bisphosphate aldolase, class I